MAAILAGLVSQAGATTITYQFDPNDWVNLFSTDTDLTRLQQDNPRLLIDGVTTPTDAAGYPGYHTTYDGATYSSSGIQGFADQVQSVEIHDFNMWLADGINAPNWGEVLTQVQGSMPSGTAANGWAVDIIANPWPQAGYGSFLVQWYDVGYWDDDPNTSANPLLFGGPDFDLFTMTVDINATDVYGNPVDFSESQRVWLGTMLPVSWTADPSDVVYSGNRRFEGVMLMKPVPEPATMTLLGIGLAGMAATQWRRRVS